MSPGLVVVCLFVTLAPSLMAQTDGTGALTGTVTDPTGAPVAFAMVTTTSVDTGQVRPAATGTDGTYKFSLPPGNYRVKFESPGYKMVEIPAATISETETVVQDCKLEADAQTNSNTSQRLLRSRQRPLPITRRRLRWRISASLRLRPRAVPRLRHSLTDGRTCSRSINGSV